MKLKVKGTPGQAFRVPGGGGSTGLANLRVGVLNLSVNFEEILSRAQGNF
jgi:hypothetical protein